MTSESHGLPAHREGTPAPPVPAALSHLRSSNQTGLGLFAIATALTAGGIALSVGQGWAAWFAGQLLFGAAMVQWFALLHECGHDTLFRTRWLNPLVGRIAAFFAVIPFHAWKRVHGRHHKWAGWQDVDPTTAALVPRPLSRGERLLMNTCWRFWIPLFAVLYRVNNFWNVPRLLSLFAKRDDRRRLMTSLALSAGAYVAVVALFGPGLVLRIAGLALLVALIAEDLLLLSQHTHIPQRVSHGEAVRPFPTIEQEVFTRSIVLPNWMSDGLVAIDAHELHHMYPFVPGYRLRAIPYDTVNAIGWWTWTRRARALPGEVFLFQNRLETGADI
jgi:omega-6 fatty acid desaturase (delta-12 desaturase)